MLYDLSKELDRERFKVKVKVLIEKGTRVEITQKTYRSIQQNRYLHLLLGVVAMETGNTLEYVKEYYFKRLVNPSIFVLEQQDRLIGKVSIVKSSARITKEEMSIAIDRFKKWGASEGFYLPGCDNEKALAEIEREMSRYRGFI